MKNIFLVLSIVFSVSSLCAQDEIIAEGKITDTHTDKGVRSNIRYSSIPTGGITGRLAHPNIKSLLKRRVTTPKL
jgi:OOP family OmpA-OmpF porin